MVRPVGAFGGVAAADEEERAGDFFEVETEILAAHGRRHFAHHVGAEDPAAGFRSQPRHFRVVDGGRQVAAVIQLRRAAEGRADVLGHAADERLAVAADLRLEGTGRAGQLRFRGDDVERAAGFHDAGGEHGAFQRVDLAADEGLQRADQLCRRHGRVVRLMGRSAVSALSVQLHRPRVGTGHHRPRAPAQHARRQRAPQVHAENRVDAVKRAPVFYHGPRALHEFGRFLRGLEDQPHRAAQLRSRLAEYPRRAQQHGHVAVVPAGVHDAGALRRKRQARLLRDRQRVDVGAQGDPPPGKRARNVGDHAGGPSARADGDVLAAHLRQRRRDGIAGLHFVEGKLGKSMKMPPPGDDGIFDLLGAGFEVRRFHGSIPADGDSHAHEDPAEQHYLDDQREHETEPAVEGHARQRQHGQHAAAGGITQVGDAVADLERHHGHLARHADEIGKRDHHGHRRHRLPRAGGDQEVDQAVGDRHQHGGGVNAEPLQRRDQPVNDGVGDVAVFHDDLNG